MSREPGESIVRKKPGSLDETGASHRRLLRYHTRISQWASSRFYALLTFVIAGIVVATFLVAEALDAPWLAAPSGYLAGAHPGIGMLGVALLASDVLLPVPSSGVMIALGASFGVLGGSTLSIIGGALATLVAFIIGRRGQRLIDRFTDIEQQERASRLWARHGFWAIVATRPIPVVAETVGVLSGTAGAMAWWKVVLAGILGNVLPAVAYAHLGAHATGHVSPLAIIAAVMGLSLLVWLGQRSHERWRTGGPPG